MNECSLEDRMKTLEENFNLLVLAAKKTSECLFCLLEALDPEDAAADLINIKSRLSALEDNVNSSINS